MYLSQRMLLSEPEHVSLNNFISGWSHLESSSVVCKDTLLSIVENLRLQLTQLVMKKENLLDEEIIELSQRLDKYIVLIQKHQRR
jgi:hypothetical protein